MVTKSGRARGFLNPLCLFDWNVQDLFVVTSCDGKDKIECILYRGWVLFLIGEEKRKPCWNQYIRSIEPSPSVIKWRRSDIPRGDNKIHFWQFGGVNLAVVAKRNNDDRSVSYQRRCERDTKNKCAESLNDISWF